MLVKVLGYPIIRASAMIDYTNTPVAQITDITVRADITGDLNNRYFHMWSANNGTAYTFWFNVDAGGTPPNIPYTTPIEVAISTDDTAEDVADALATAIAAQGDFTTATASGTSDTVTVTNAANGGSDAPRDAWAFNETDKPIMETSFSFDVTVKGIAFNLPTNLPCVRITGKMHSEKPDHNQPVRGGQGGASIYVESPFQYNDVEMIVQSDQIQYVLER